MDVKKLKRVYDAARALNGHNQEEAAREVKKSQSMINQVLAGTATSQPTVDAILKYCYRAGLRRSVEKLGLDPEMKMQPATA